MWLRYPPHTQMQRPRPLCLPGGGGGGGVALATPYSCNLGRWNIGISITLEGKRWEKEQKETKIERTHSHSSKFSLCPWPGGLGLMPPTLQVQSTVSEYAYTRGVCHSPVSPSLQKAGTCPAAFFPKGSRVQGSWAFPKESRRKR